ncbi:MAG: shikimate dehydrogenase, partial [Proteobacteria bacterium]|nr:shikimate dehydrogenase [Pseudomonadota bacterium]
MNAMALLAGVIGWPVAHSLSPRVHRYWLRTLGIAGDYVPLAVRPDGLAAAIAGLRALGFAGANVTVPHKAAVLPLLDSFDDIARRAGGANTLVVGADGAITGTSTDGFGFLESLRAAVPGWTP